MCGIADKPGTTNIEDNKHSATNYAGNKHSAGTTNIADNSNSKHSDCDFASRVFCRCPSRFAGRASNRNCCLSCFSSPLCPARNSLQPKGSNKTQPGQAQSRIFSNNSYFSLLVSKIFIAKLYMDDERNLNWVVGKITKATGKIDLRFSSL